jgi:linoleoyl-CoA desaturase
MWLVMGFGMAGIGLAVMHDANHGVYSKNKRINRLLGYSLDLVGGNSSNWRIQHNVLHHTYTNVDGMDEDINGHTFIRLSPHQRRHRFQRFQHIYAWFFYGIMTLYWVTVKDIFQLKRYRDKGLVKGKSKYRSLMLELILWKIVYFGYILILPMILLPVSPLLIIFSFLSMHFIGGLVLSSIFQPAHVVPSSEYKPMDDQSSIKNTWAIHQLLTTTNFAPSSRILSWYIGGLNYQIEHHLFPNICHIHYRAIAGIIEKTAAQFELPYHSQKNFALALINHGRMLRSLGRHDRLTRTTAN